MTFADIKTCFQTNQARVADLAWDDPHQLGPAELRAVRTSLQTFQRGEGSGGDHLLALARQLGDADYVAAMQLCIQEEEGHAAMLGQFMERQGIERLRTHWLHEAFRRLGRPLGLVPRVRIALMLKVVATICYRALFNATYSGLLQQICRRMLRDEELHLAFHCVAIRQLSPRRTWLSRALWGQAYRALLAGTALVVYATNRRTLRAGGYGLVGFCAAVATEYARAEHMQQATGPLPLRGEPVATSAATGPAGAWQWPGPRLRPAQ